MRISDWSSDVCSSDLTPLCRATPRRSAGGALMRIRELRVENFRKFRQPLHLTGFEDGLNLVCEQNEAGKSTVLEALRAVLFERHGSRSDRIRSFRPHGDEVAPTIELGFDLGDARWRLRNRFLPNPSV